MISRRQLIWIGSICAALIPIGTVLGALSPVLKREIGGPLPYASVQELQMAQATIQQLQRNNAALAVQNQQVNRNLDLTTLTGLNIQLQLAQHEAGQNPNQSERSFMQQLKDQINAIRARLGLPPIQ